MSTDPAVRELARRLAKLTDLFRQQSASNLPSSSMEGGQVRVYRPGTEGSTVGVELGTQYDGNYGATPLIGLLPPPPTKPTVRVIGNVVFVAWDGHFADSTYTVAPSDWKETEIHIGDSPASPDFAIAANTMVRPSFTSARGGEIGVAGLTSGVDYYAVLTARTTPGRFSAPSEIVGPIRVGAIPSIQLDASQLTYLGGVDPAGSLVYSTDDTGRASLEDLNVGADPTFQGRPLSQIILEDTPQSVGYFECFVPANSVDGYGDYGPITSRVGIMEVNAYLAPGHRYSIGFKSTWFPRNTPSECRYTLVYTGPSESGSDTADTPAFASTQVDQFLFPGNYSEGYQTAAGSTTFTPTTLGRHRFLLCIELGSAPGQPSTSDVWVVSGLKNIITITDTGAARPVTGVQTRAGGAFSGGTVPPPPPPPTQQYYADIGTDNRGRYRGNGVFRTDTSDVVQGWDPSGFNGDGYGWFGFGNLPVITGNVDRVDMYLYWNHWYYNSGGAAIISPIRAGDGSLLNSLKLRGNLIVGGYPKPGGVWITLPSDWWPLFRSGGQFYGIGLGPSGGTNLGYYGRASDCRLRISYTQ